MSGSEYLVRLWRHGKVARDFGTTEAHTPKQAIIRLAAEYGDWPYEDDADGSGSVVDPANPERYVMADPVLQDAEEDIELDPDHLEITETRD